MISSKEELLHEGEKISEWEEAYRFNFADKKSKLHGWIDIEFFAKKKKILFTSSIVCSNELYSAQSESDFESKPGSKIISAKGFKYKIVNNDETFSLSVKTDSIDLECTVTGVCPIYDFPFAAADADTQELTRILEQKVWNRYEQRSRFSGTLKLKKPKTKEIVKKIDCFGQREHSWGARPWNETKMLSWLTMQARDWGMGLRYIEFDQGNYSCGFITRKSGNIPIVNAELENIDKPGAFKNVPAATEFSFKDAQDDKDLVVSTQLFGIELAPRTLGKRKFLHFRNFSEFTIIGVNKKALGFEDHFVLKK